MNARMDLHPASMEHRAVTNVCLCPLSFSSGSSSGDSGIHLASAGSSSNTSQNGTATTLTAKSATISSRALPFMPATTKDGGGGAAPPPTRSGHTSLPFLRYEWKEQWIVDRPHSIIVQC